MNGGDCIAEDQFYTFPFNSKGKNLKLRYLIQQRMYDLITPEDEDLYDLIGYTTETSMTRFDDNAVIDNAEDIDARILDLLKEEELDNMDDLRERIDPTEDPDIHMRLKGWVNCLFIKNLESDSGMVIPCLKKKNKETHQLEDFFLVKHRRKDITKLGAQQDLLNSFSVRGEDFGDAQNSVAVVSTHDIQLYDASFNPTYNYTNMKIVDCHNVH